MKGSWVLVGLSTRRRSMVVIFISPCSWRTSGCFCCVFGMARRSPSNSNLVLLLPAWNRCVLLSEKDEVLRLPASARSRSSS